MVLLCNRLIATICRKGFMSTYLQRGSSCRALLSMRLYARYNASSRVKSHCLALFNQSCNTDFRHRQVQLILATDQSVSVPLAFVSSFAHPPLFVINLNLRCGKQISQAAELNSLPVTFAPLSAEASSSVNSSRAQSRSYQIQTG